MELRGEVSAGGEAADGDGVGVDVEIVQGALAASWGSKELGTHTHRTLNTVDNEMVTT